MSARRIYGRPRRPRFCYFRVLVYVTVVSFDLQGITPPPRRGHAAVLYHRQMYIVGGEAGITAEADSVNAPLVVLNTGMAILSQQSPPVTHALPSLASPISILPSKTRSSGRYQRPWARLLRSRWWGRQLYSSQAPRVSSFRAASLMGQRQALFTSTLSVCVSLPLRSLHFSTSFCPASILTIYFGAAPYGLSTRGVVAADR